MSGMDSAPTVSAAAAVGTGTVGGGCSGGYPDSQDSSPRSRGGESWDEPPPPSSASAVAAAPQKLRLMCSYGGHIMPRPHDKTLCYLGGDTRIVVVDRHATLTELCGKISRSLLGGRQFTLKYQLPSEDLDSLISVTTDEDLENMIDEYDRIAGGSSRVGGGGGGGVGAGKSSRLRLFLFPVKVETSPSSSIGSLLDDPKSETWFVDALNGGPVGMGGVLPRRLSDDSMASSINCLLGLEEDHRNQKVSPSDATPPIEQVGGGDHGLSHDHHQQLLRPDSPGKLSAAAGKNNGQEVQSMPDSPMLDTSSSFGSTSSAPSLSNLPPIRVRPDDPNHDQRPAIVGLEEHFAHMVVSTQKQDEGLKDGAFVAAYQQLPPHPTFINAVASPPSATTSATTVFSPTEHPQGGNRVFSSDDEKSDHGAVGKPPQQPHASPGPVQHPRASVPDLHNAERPMLHPDRASPGAGVSSPVCEILWEGQNSLLISNARVPTQSPEQGYLIPVQQQQLQQQQQQQQHHQYQQLQQHQYQQLQQQMQQQQQPQQHQQQQPQQHQQQQTLPSLPHYLHSSPHLVPYPSYYLQPQQHVTPTPHYNQQVPLYYIPVHANPPYPPLPTQSNLGDTAATPGNAAISIPNAMAPAQPANPPQPTPELVAGAAMYRTSVAGNTAVAPPPPSPQLIHLADRMQQPYMGYHAAHHHASQNLVAAGYGYEFANTVHSQPMYYAQASSAPLATPYQAVSSAGATMIPDHQPQMHLADANQTKASS